METCYRDYINLNNKNKVHNNNNILFQKNKYINIKNEQIPKE